MIPKLITFGTNQACVNIDKGMFYFSYETCVAFQNNHIRIRRENQWSNTTARHMTNMGVKEFTVVSDKEFERLINEGS